METETIAEPEAPPPATDTGWMWPQSTEARSLIVPWDDHDRSEAAVSFAAIQGRKNDVESRKKAASSAFKAQLDAIEEELNTLAERINDDGHVKKVPCTWRFECAGKDEAGNWIDSTEKKALVRDDTGEVVEVAAISDDDRQAVMNLAPLSDEDAEAYLASVHHCVTNDDDGFYLEIVDGDRVAVLLADNRSAALQEACASLRVQNIAAPQPETTDEPATEETDDSIPL